MNTISTFLRRVLGRGWVAGLLFLATLLMFGYLVPTQIAGITQNGALTPKILDEHMMGWSAADASTLFEAIGATGREAYRIFYLSLDFWFPVLTAALFMISVLSLVFPAGSAGSRLNLVPLGFYVLDVAENLIHFTMAGAYPAQPALLWTLGPAVTLGKWWLIFASLLLIAIGAIGLLRDRRGRPRPANAHRG
jgi:hypothetical protein